MAVIRVTQKSFTGGELSPELFAGDDLAKYSVGLRSLKNGFCRQERSVSNRPGLELVGETKDSNKKSRLIPFSFNTQQTYMIEAGEKYFRYIKDGGYIIYPDDYEDVSIRGQIVETVTPYLAEDLPLLKYAQNADVLTLTHKKYNQHELERHSHYDWILKTINFTPSINPPSSVTATRSGSSDTQNLTTYKYVVTAIEADTYEESNRSAEATVQSHIESKWVEGEKITISYEAVFGATEYNIYRSVNGIFAFVGTSTSTSFVDDKIEPDLSATAPITRNPFANENYPGVVSYFQQRKIYANSENNPQTLWASQLGTSNNFNISRPLIASDSITLALSEREVNEIRHLIGLKYDLIVLTSSAEWSVSGNEKSFSANPPPLATPQTYYGSSHIQPIVSGNMILFVQSGGSVVRDLGYSYLSEGYDGDELSIFANHLFEGKQVNYMAYAKEPYRIVWCVMSDGTVNGLTYNRKQEINGWHKHTTKGEFESVACIREGYEDVVYFIIKRIINGQTKRFVERMATRIVNDAKDGFFVDCGLKYEGSPISSVSGLEHLENEEVIVLADGGVVEGLKVENGRINLPRSASKIVVGLSYEFDLETLNIEGENTQGLKKAVNHVSIKIHKSREDFFIVGADGVPYQNQRNINSINNSGLLSSGDVENTIISSFTPEATVHIKQPYPLPLTISSISAVVNVEDVPRGS